jgi:hypothetical protein
MEKMMTMIQLNFIVEQMTSTSPKMLTPKTLTSTMTTQKMEIQAATGTLSVQKLSTVVTAWSSLAMVMTFRNQYAQPRANAAEGQTNLPVYVSRCEQSVIWSIDATDLVHVDDV